jgi:hypothetical protein
MQWREKSKDPAHTWFHKSKYWDMSRNQPMQIVTDMRKSKDMWNPGDGYVTLLDRDYPRRIALQFEQELRNPSIMAALLYENFDVNKERVQFLRRVHNKPDAVRFAVEKHPSEAYTVLEKIFNAEDVFKRLDTGVGRDRALAYLQDRYEQKQVSDILGRTLSPEEYFTAMEHLYAQHVPEERFSYVPMEGGSSSSVGTNAAMLVHK